MKKFATLLMGAIVASVLPVRASQTTFDFSQITSATTAGEGYCTFTQDGFTLSVNRSANECLVGGTLHLPLGATLTVTQADGRCINMWGIDGYASGNNRLKATNMVNSIGSFGTDDNAKVPTKDWGNDYSAFGFNGEDYKTSDGVNYVVELYSDAPSYTFKSENYGIDGKYIYFNKLTVRDDDVTTGLVDKRGVYHNFSFRISNDMVPVSYRDGVLYCRSVAESESPKQQNSQGLPLGPGQDPKNYTNYDWIALNLSSALKAEFDEMNADDYLNHVLKGGSVWGLYCDYSANGNNHMSFLNPTMNISEMPEITDEIVNTTKNTYYVANMVEQKTVFFMAPKLNEVCRVMYVVAGYNCNDYGDNGDVYNAPFQIKGEEIYGHVRLINHRTLQDDGKTYKSMFSFSFPDLHSYNLTDALVQMSFYPQCYYTWNFQGDRYTAYVNDNGSQMYDLPYYYQQNVEQMYYGVYNQYALQINCVLQRTTPGYVPTAVTEASAGERQVASVTYINIYGQTSSEPFAGVNLQLTRYTDGTTATTKFLR